MTTIACDGVSIAADSLVTGGGFRCAERHEKLFVTPDGNYVGTTGFTDDGHAVRKWFETGCPDEKPDIDGSFEALVLTRDGTFYLSSKLVMTKYYDVMAIGSGGEIAIGAMLAGKKPHEAVAIAIGRDTRSGGPISMASLK